MQEEKVYFSGKHKLYGFKVEVAVRPNGIVSASSNRYPGSISDISIMYDRIHSHKCRLEKRDEEKEFADNFPMSDRFGNYWSVLMDKFYQRGIGRAASNYTKKKAGSRGTISGAFGCTFTIA